MRAAARKLGVTQPALTKAMHRLESETGVTLFDRRSRGVSLTVYGESFRRHARTIRAGMAEAESEIGALRDGTSGRVRLGAGPSWQGRVIPEAIRRFRNDRPGVRLQVMGGTDDVLKAELRAGRLDLVVAAVPEGDEAPDLESRALMVDEYRVIADRSHPLQTARSTTIADLLDHPWILPNPRTYLVRRLEVLMRSNGLAPPRPMIETDILELKLALMRDSTYLSFHAIDHLRRTGVADVGPLPLEAAGWKRSAGIITRKSVEANPAAAHLADLIEGLCGPDREPAARRARVEWIPAG